MATKPSRKAGSDKRSAKAGSKKAAASKLPGGKKAAVQVPAKKATSKKIVPKKPAEKKPARKKQGGGRKRAAAARTAAPRRALARPKVVSPVSPPPEEVPPEILPTQPQPSTSVIHGAPPDGQAARRLAATPTVPRVGPAIAPQPATPAAPIRPAVAERPQSAGPWLALGVVAILAAAAITWLALDRRSLSADVAAARRQIDLATSVSADLEAQVQDLEERLIAASDVNRAASQSLQVCVGALEDGVRLYNALARELSAAASLNESEADRLHAEAVALRERASRSLERCRRAVSV